MSWLSSFEHSRPFTADEAWWLYRLAAYGEALGWTLLISGLAVQKYLMHGNNDPVLVAGQLHGTLFLIYFAAAIVLYPSLRWSRPQALLAIIAGVPPYGSLVFEQWAARNRSRARLTVTVRNAYYRQLIQPAE